MKKILFVSLCVATLMSCGQKQGPSEQEIQERIDAAVKAALEEQSATKQESADYSQNESNSEHPSISSEPDNSGVSTDVFYQKGYERGMGYAQCNTLEYFTRNDAKEIKSLYQSWCNYGRGGKGNATNRELFEQFKKGFIQGYNDGNAL